MRALLRRLPLELRADRLHLPRAPLLSVPQTPAPETDLGAGLAGAVRRFMILLVLLMLAAAHVDAAAVVVDQRDDAIQSEPPKKSQSVRPLLKNKT